MWEAGDEETGPGWQSQLAGQAAVETACAMGEAAEVEVTVVGAAGEAAHGGGPAAAVACLQVPAAAGAAVGALVASWTECGCPGAGCVCCLCSAQGSQLQGRATLSHACACSRRLIKIGYLETLA